VTKHQATIDGDHHCVVRLREGEDVVELSLHADAAAGYVRPHDEARP